MIVRIDANRLPKLGDGIASTTLSPVREAKVLMGRYVIRLDPYRLLKLGDGFVRFVALGQRGAENEVSKRIAQAGASSFLDRRRCPNRVPHWLHV